jgi:uncharacterized protein YcgI (DUF1989 family)
MLTTLADTYPNHCGNVGGRCSERVCALRDCVSSRRSCQQNLTEALAPFGVSGDDIVDTFNAFMKVDLHPDGSFNMLPSEAGADDDIDLRAEMDVLAAVSACPSDGPAPNGGRIKPLGFKIYD